MQPGDAAAVNEIFAQARIFMAQTGNPHQWAGSYPGLPEIEQDIKNGTGYVLVGEENGTQKVIGTFELFDYEPSYDKIDGAWLDDGPYVAVHRLATTHEDHAGTYILKYLMERHPSIRIDTMDRNRPLRSLLEKLGFVQTGIIYMQGRGPRTAYQYLKDGQR